MTLATLIDKQDTAELIRDQLASILAIESAAQVALATTAGKPDPSLWKLRVYTERATVWENLPDGADESPVVNVWWDSSAFEMSASNIVERQKCSAVFNVDCYGFGRSADTPGGGHTPGDEAAAKAVQRAVRLVRNVLMAGEYTYLALRGTVWRRWVDSVTMMQPQQDNQNVFHKVAARVAFRVEFSEFAPQVVPTTLDLLTVGVLRAEDGELLVQADYDYTA